MQWRQIRLLTVLYLLLLLGLTGCNSNREPSGARGGKPKVVATFSVLGDLVRNVAGDQVEVITLVGPDGDTHTFEPTPQDGVSLAKADLIFENGAGLEPWLDGLCKSSESKARRVVVSKGLKLIEADEGEHKHEEKGAKKDDGGHKHEEVDPHVWHDVNNAIHIVEVIRDQLAEMDAANAEKYRDNAASYLQQLKDLDAWVLQTVAPLPESERKLVTSHDTFGYFVRRYGFKLLGSGLESFSTEASDPSAAVFAKLCNTIKEAKVPAIFAENVQNPKLMQRLAKEAGVRLGPPLFTDALGKEGSDGDTYVKMMRYNVKTIVTQLKQ
ncbi:MAG TPA: zinc ABC transporter substrate-binding protein [Gemmataceae bacterium]|nr:zinc ABC transporter substrate-binding protein [Gemmataceae bacterium]